MAFSYNNKFSQLRRAEATDAVVGLARIAKGFVTLASMALPSQVMSLFDIRLSIFVASRGLPWPKYFFGDRNTGFSCKYTNINSLSTSARTMTQWTMHRFPSAPMYFSSVIIIPTTRRTSRSYILRCFGSTFLTYGSPTFESSSAVDGIGLRVTDGPLKP